MATINLVTGLTFGPNRIMIGVAFGTNPMFPNVVMLEDEKAMSDHKLHVRRTT